MSSRFCVIWGSLLICFENQLAGFQGKYYLWGVFKAKRDSSGNTTMPNGRSKPSTWPTPVNQLAVVRDVVNAKTWDSRFSPLSNRANFGSWSVRYSLFVLMCSSHMCDLVCCMLFNAYLADEWECGEACFFSEPSCCGVLTHWRT